MKRILKLALYLPIFWLICAPLMAQDKSDYPTINILSNSKRPQYNQVVESFKQSIVAQQPGVNFNEVNSLRKLQIKPDEFVFSLGTKWLKNLVRDEVNQNVLATMILNEKGLDSLANATGIVLKFSAKQQLLHHKEILPKAKRIGVLYNPAINQTWVDKAKVIAKELELEIVAVPVHSPVGIPAALNTLAREADSLLSIPDKTVYSSKTAKAILLFSYNNKIPFVGLSEPWVKAGALYALDWDYAALGEQCARVALKILEGVNPADIAQDTAGKETYMINLKTAKQLKIEMLAPTINSASKVYQ